MLTLSNYVLCLSRRCFCCCCCTDAECVSIIVAAGCCIFFHSVLLADILSIRNESCDEGDVERERVRACNVWLHFIAQLFCLAVLLEPNAPTDDDSWLSQLSQSLAIRRKRKAY